MLMPDAADPSILTATVSSVRSKDLFGAPPQIYISQITNFVTFDGGVHWEVFHCPVACRLEWLATYHGTTLAVLGNGEGTVNLWSSKDQLQTWHELTQAPSGSPGLPLNNPLINPATGDLLVFGENGNNQGDMYESSDLGEHWTSVPVPSDFSPSLVSPPVAGQPWRLCGIEGAVSDSPFSAGTQLCSMDNGRTWTVRPQLITTFDNTDKGLVVPQVAQEVAVGADGTIYAFMPSSMWPQGIPGGLYQLTPQATRWQPLTFPLGNNAVDTTNLPGSGILWAVPVEVGPGLAGPFPTASV
jgi:hypothetical protein